MVGNLLDNASKWAKSRVSVSAAQADGAGTFEVLVDDDGPGFTGPERFELEPSPQGGLRARLELPAARAPSSIA
jgi:nitrate/nitrite-specific signal transduction histidine kinase